MNTHTHTHTSPLIRSENMTNRRRIKILLIIHNLNSLWCVFMRRVKARIPLTRRRHGYVTGHSATKSNFVRNILSCNLADTQARRIEELDNWHLN
jgi:hypothetical protein